MASKSRLVLYLTRAELKAAKAMARAAGLRTPNQWALTVIIKALILK